MIVSLGCRESDDAHIRGMTTGISSTGGVDQQDHTVEFEMPHGLRIPDRPSAMLIDETGRTFRTKEFSIGRSSSGPDTFRGKFRGSPEQKPAILRLGEYVIDVRNSRVKKLR